MNEQATGRARRSAKNFLVKPRQQLRYATVLFGGSAGLLALYMIVLLTSLISTLGAMTRQYDLPPELLTALTKSLSSSIVFVAALGLVLTVGMLAIGVTLSHRIFGPMIPIQRLVKSLKDGDYAARGILRKNDEFKDLMDDLNALAESLENINRRK